MISMQFLIATKNHNHKNQGSKCFKNTNAFSNLERYNGVKSYNGMEGTFVKKGRRKKEGRKVCRNEGGRERRGGGWCPYLGVCSTLNKFYILFILGQSTWNYWSHSYLPKNIIFIQFNLVGSRLFSTTCLCIGLVVKSNMASHPHLNGEHLQTRLLRWPELSGSACLTRTSSLLGTRSLQVAVFHRVFNSSLQVNVLASKPLLSVLSFAHQDLLQNLPAILPTTNTSNTMEFN